MFCPYLFIRSFGKDLTSTYFDSGPEMKKYSPWPHGIYILVKETERKKKSQENKAG